MFSPLKAGSPSLARLPPFLCLEDWVGALENQPWPWEPPGTPRFSISGGSTFLFLFHGQALRTAPGPGSARHPQMWSWPPSQPNSRERM